MLWKGFFRRSLTAAGVIGLLAAAPGACVPVMQPSPLEPSPTAAALGAPAAHARAAVASSPDANRARDAIPDRFKWNLSPLFASDHAFDAELKAVADERAKLDTFRGKLSRPGELLACLDQYFAIRLRTNKLTLYAQMRFDTNQKDTAAQTRNDRALAAMNALMGSASFIRQEVLGLDDRAMNLAFRSKKELEKHRPYLDELRRRRSRVLSPDAERVLSLAGDNLWAEIDLNEIPSDHEKTFESLLSDVTLPTVQDEAGLPVQLTLSNFGKFRASPDRRVRRDTVEGLFATLRSLQHAFAATLSGQVRNNVFLARSRGYESALQAYLDKDNIDPAVYHNLVSAVHANLAPLHRYIRLRKRIMQVDDLHIYDLYTPMVESVEMRVPYDRAVEILPTALAPLGERYLAALRQGLDPANGWIDIYPHKDKRSGAFSSGVFGLHPYVKMNYFETVDDFSTLAHEYGHALHSHLAMSKQPYVTANYTAFIAEIASTFNEKLLSDYLIEHATSDAEKLYLLNELVETIRTTIFRQTLFAEFELAIHTAAEQGTPLTADFLNETYEKLVRTYYGPDFAVGPNDGLEWAYIPHFYFKYYVYAYATGLSSGIALAERVQRGGPEARDAYLEMLESGSARPPLELLRRAGVDLTKPDAIEAATRLMDSTLLEMERLIAKVPALAPH